MLIKYAALDSYLKADFNLYVFVGDEFVIQEAIDKIKQTKAIESSEYKILDINKPADWELLVGAANNYSLFSENIFLDLRYAKKTLEAAGKTVLEKYLTNINPHCYILLRAPNVSAKTLGFLSKYKNVLIIQAYAFSGSQLQQWIRNKLKTYNLKYDGNLPAIIQQYTEGNMLACAQLIEVISLIHEPNLPLAEQDILPYLSLQYDDSIYELSNAYLGGNIDKSIRLMRHAMNINQEPTLILWIIGQDLRNLIQLHHCMLQGLEWKQVCVQLKIWASRENLYRAAMNRLPLAALYSLLQKCRQIDDYIKRSNRELLFQLFETVMLLFCSPSSSIHDQ